MKLRTTVLKIASAPALLVYILMLTSMVSAAGLMKRQDDNAEDGEADDAADDKNTAAATSAFASAAAATSDEASVTSSVESSASASAYASASASETSDALSPVVTDNPTPLNSTNDPSNCHLMTEDNNGEVDNALCEPQADDVWGYNGTYFVVWDPNMYRPTSSITVYLFSTDYLNSLPDDTNFTTYLPHSVTTTLSVPARLGRGNFTTTEAMLNGTDSVSLTLQLVNYPNQTEGAETEGNSPRLFSGPQVTLRNVLAPNSTNNATASSDNNGGSDSKELGQKVGIPIGLIFFLAIIGILAFIVLRRRRGNNGGYLSRKSHSERTGGGASGLVGPHRRTASFHDEPVRGGGVELQERGHQRGASGGGSSDWGWGSPRASEGGGNVFREEVGRQRGRGS